MHGSVGGLAAALAAIQQHLEGGKGAGGGRSLPSQRPPGADAAAAGAGAGVGAACAAMAAGAGAGVRPPSARGASAGGCAFCSAVSGASGAVGGSVGSAPMTAEARLERLEATVSELVVSVQGLLGKSPQGKRSSRLQRLMTPPPLRAPTGSASAPSSPLEA